jgi:hypothetical protein
MDVLNMQWKLDITGMVYKENFITMKENHPYVNVTRAAPEVKSSIVLCMFY